MNARRTTQPFDSVTVNGTAAILGPLAEIFRSTPTDLFYRFRSAGTPGAAAAQIDYRISATGGSSTDAADRDEWSPWISLLAAVISNDLERVAMPAISAPYYQLRITGTGGNPADTVADIWVINREGVL